MLAPISGPVRLLLQKHQTMKIHQADQVQPYDSNKERYDELLKVA
jgi:hypothetical protein